MKIALIDSGIVQTYRQYVQECYYIKDGEICPGNRETLNKHGSICAAILKKYNKESEIISIQILNENGRTDIQNLVVALEWCIHQEIPVISLSAGSMDIDDEKCLQDIVSELTEKKIVLVAAANNSNTVTYPASMKGVVGVKCDLSNTLSPEEIFVDVKDIRNIEVTVGTLKDCEDLKEYRLGFHNSFVVPYVSAKVAGLLEQGCKDVLQELSVGFPSVSMDFYRKSFPLMYSPNPIRAQLSGRDYQESQILKLIEIFRKAGYCAVGIMKEKTDHAYCYCCTMENGLEGGEAFDFIEKAADPDIVFWGNLPVHPRPDIEILVDNSKESYQLGRQGEEESWLDEKDDDEDMQINAQYLGAIGNYGVTVLGGIGENEEITKEEMYFDERIPEEERDLIISKINESLLPRQAVEKEEEEVEETISVTTRDIHDGKLIEILEEIFS